MPNIFRNIKNYQTMSHTHTSAAVFYCGQKRKAAIETLIHSSRAIRFGWANLIESAALKDSFESFVEQ